MSGLGVIIQRLTDLERQVERNARAGPQEARLIEPFLRLPGLRGFWPMSSVDDAGMAYDLSGQVRHMTYNGNPTYNLADYAPYIDLDGAGDYLSRADEAGLDITGTETTIASALRGLTLGGWFYFNGAAAAVEDCLTKRGAAGQLAYYAGRLATGLFDFVVSVDGTATVNVSSTDILAATTWYFCAARFTPSTELLVYVNGTPDTNTVGVPASIFNSNAALVIGGYAGGSALLTGRASCCFLCAAALPDIVIDALYRRTAPFFV